MPPKDKFYYIFKRWQEEPLCFVRECLGVEKISNQQEEGLILVGKMANAKLKRSWGHKLTDEEAVLAAKTGITIRAGQGVGKDTFLSWVLLWLVFCFSGKQSTAGGLVTAPSAAVLYDALWREIRTWITRSKFPLGDYLEVQHDRLFHKKFKGICEIVGRTVQATGNVDEEAASLGGRHWQYHINCVDEASGVADGIFKPIEGSLTETMAFAIYIANPTRASGHFYKTHTEYRNFWECRQWNAEESTINDIVPGMRDKIDKDIAQYGRDSNYVRIRVFGEFPSADDDTVIPYYLCEEAIDRDLSFINFPKIAGLDIARFGNDANALVVRQGGRIIHAETWKKCELSQTAGKVMDYHAVHGFDHLALDVIGLGAGVASHLYEVGARFPITEVNVAESPAFGDQYNRLRDELWFKTREWFEERKNCIPSNLKLKDQLIAELTTPRFYFTAAGKRRVESKEDMKRRGIASPNVADALIMTFCGGLSSNRVGRSAVTMKDMPNVLL